MIHAMTDTYTIKELCEALGLSRSGYYRWRNPPVSKRKEQEVSILSEVRALHAEHRQRLGSPRMKKHLDQRGVVCGRHRVARLMRDHSIRARRKRPFRPKTTQPGKAPCPNLLVDIPALTAPNQSWVSDITYVPTKEGFL
jgi:transposase InsO family protein